MNSKLKKSFFKKKTILITGGTGSFGYEATKILLNNYDLKKIIIFSRDEFKQSEMSKFFKNYFAKKFNKLRFFIGDVRDFDRLTYACREVDCIVHAAAMKQVETSEYNPMECIKTNILGAENVVRASIQNKVKHVIALSTDKAVNPINLYGATKLASDKIFISANNIVGSQNTLFSVVRYGNVIGSRGSVEPLFLELSKKKAKFFPITDLEMTRFWLELSAGVDFVIDSFVRMKGGEIFIPKIPSVRIIDLAQSINPKIKYKVIGIRPGEKLHELLYNVDDSNIVIEFKDHYVIPPSIIFNKKKKYFTNLAKEQGVKGTKNKELSSNNNKWFLNEGDLTKMYYPK